MLRAKPAVDDRPGASGPGFVDDVAPAGLGAGESGRLGGTTRNLRGRPVNIRCLVVDDDPVGRDRIVSLLDRTPEAEVVDECGTGSQAIHAIGDHSPDLVFLDVQIPEVDGFGVIEAIRAARAPAIVFVTACEEYALKAFEARACDYVLKPVAPERFGAAFRHAADRVRAERANDLLERLAGLVERLEGASPPCQRLPIRTHGRFYFLDIDEIDWLEASDNYVKVHARGKAHMIRQTLGCMEESLRRRGFVRVHRSAIVNIARIREIQPWFSGEYVVVMRNGAKVRSSRAYRSNLRALVG